MSIKDNIQQTKRWIQEAITAWSIKNGIPNQLEKLNTLVIANPKKSLGITMGVLLLLFFTALILAFISKGAHEESFNLSQIDDVSSIIETKRRIEEVKRQQVDDVRSILTQGQVLKKELDSLLALPSKTHHDSLEILRKHKQLEIIVRHINEKD